MSNPDAGSPSNRATYCVPGEQCDKCPVRNLPELSPAIPGAIRGLERRPEEFQPISFTRRVQARTALQKVGFMKPTRKQEDTVMSAMAMILSHDCSVELSKGENDDQ